MKRLICFVLSLTFITSYYNYTQAQEQPKPTVNAVLEGKVYDSTTRRPISDASIQIKGVTNGTVSNQQGAFTLYTGQKFPFTIVVTVVGYEPKEIVATGSPVDVYLKPVVNQLEDVVVVGYDTRRKKDIIGAQAHVKAAEVNHLPVASMDAQLQGKAAGLQVNSQNGIPGDAVVVRVRGAATINASADPLYIIDGVFVNNQSLSTLDLGGKATSPLADINPADIESIEVLKDASATAIYGSRGANGVVIITTKQGSYNQKPKISFEALVGTAWADKSRLWKLVTGPEHAELVNEQWINSGIDNPALNRTYANRPFRPVSEGGRGLPEEQPTYDRITPLFRHALLQSYNMSYQGGNNNTRYYYGVDYTSQEAALKKADFQRGSFRVNLDSRLNKVLTVGTRNTVSVSHRNHVRAGTGPTGGIFQASIHTPTYQPIFNPDGTPFRQAFENYTVLLSDDVQQQTKSLRYIGNLYGELSFGKYVRFRTSWSADFNLYDESEYNSERTTIGSAVGGEAISSITQNLTWINEQTLSFRRSYNKLHNVSVLVGNTIQSNVLQNTRARGTGFPNSSYRKIGAASITTSNQRWSKSNLVSFFSRLDYSFDDKYYLELSVRADGSSKFGKNNRWGYFPSIGLAWRAKNEKFLSDADAISDLKLRASYGVLGNQNGISDFAARGLWSGGAGYYNTAGGAQQPGTAPFQLSNPDLRWEKTNQIDAGLDIAFFDNRLALTADAYYKYTTDLLLPLQIPAITGFSQYYSNSGEISNKGIELSLSSININKPHLTWQTQFNITRNWNKIEKLPTPLVYGSRDLIRNEEGYPLYSFWMYKQLYVDPQTGDAVFEDVNGDGVITIADRQIVGNASPKFFGGLTNEVKFKSFDLNVFFTYQFGNKVVSFDRMLMEGGGTKDAGRSILAYNLRRWQKPGDITDVPRVTSVGNNYGIEQNSRFLEDGSFVRLKSLTLGYTFPREIISRIGLSALRVYVLGSNLWLHTKYIGPDPESVHTNEQNARGIDVGTPPQPISVQFGINVTL